MFIERSGSGRHAFFGLHGWSGDHHTFDPLVRHLPDDSAFYSADLPGCGQSPDPREWTVAAIADQIADAALRVPAPFTLVGNCSGALLGLEVAKRLGDRVERLVLIDILAVFPWYFRVFVAPGIGRYAYYSTFANPLGRLLTNLSLKPKRAESTDLTQGFARVNHATTQNYLQLFTTFPQPETFEGLVQPIDILYGEKTFRAVRESVGRWQAVWPQASAWELKNAGHLPILEATGQLSEILFQERVSAGSCPVTSSTIAN